MSSVSNMFKDSKPWECYIPKLILFSCLHEWLFQMYCSYKTYGIKLYFDLHYVFPITIDSLRPKTKNSAHGSRQDIEMVWNMSRDQSQRESFVICPWAGPKTFILIFLTYMVFLELHVLKVFLLGSLYKFCN
jgi:hypothetical protein